MGNEASHCLEGVENSGASNEAVVGDEVEAQGATKARRAAAAGAPQRSWIEETATCCAQSTQCVSSAGFKILAPLDGQKTTSRLPGSPWGDQWQRHRRAFERHVGGESVRLRTLDGVELDAVWCTASEPHGSVAICFHGNAMTLDGLEPWARWYRREGIHAMLVTMRGYPGSEGSAREGGEVGMYADAEAAVRFAVETRGIARDRVVLHGYSLGGAVAAAASCALGGLPVVLDHTFTSASAIATAHADGILARAKMRLPAWAVRALASGAFPAGERLGPLESDGFDTLRKIARAKPPLLVVSGSCDDLMPDRFAEQLLAAAYPGDDAEARARRAARHVVLAGGSHTYPMLFDCYSDEAMWSGAAGAGRGVLREPAVVVGADEVRRSAADAKRRIEAWLPGSSAGDVSLGAGGGGVLVEGGPEACDGADLSGLWMVTGWGKLRAFLEDANIVPSAAEAQQVGMWREPDQLL